MQYGVPIQEIQEKNHYFYLIQKSNNEINKIILDPFTLLLL